MNVVAVIQARMDSSRFSNKAVKTIADESLVKLLLQGGILSKGLLTP